MGKEKVVDLELIFFVGWGHIGLYSGHIRVLLGLYSGHIRVLLGLYSGYIRVILGLCSGHIRVILRLYSGYIRVGLGFRVQGLGCCKHRDQLLHSSTFCPIFVNQCRKLLYQSSHEIVV